MGIYTWSNKQEFPVRVILDRVLVSNDCERTYPLLSLQTITRIGSDHSALLVESGEHERVRSSTFWFEPS
jgi:hypothetical protein